jgi:hypothetical protein
VLVIESSPLTVVDPATRIRQNRELAYIADYYSLRDRLGIMVEIGGRIRRDGIEGTIVDTVNQYLRVLWDGDTVPSVTHVTADKEYLTPDGWVRATMRPDPCAA